MRRGQFGLIMKNRVRNRDLLITTEWLSSREHLIEHYAERPQVGTSIYVPAPDLLRRHIGHGSEANTGFTATLIARFGQSKVEDPHSAVRQQHDVARLQVAVHDSGGVCGLQSLGDLSRDLQSLAQGNGTVTSQPRSERFPVVKRHRQEEPALFTRPDLVDRTKIWMVERGGSASFAEEPRFGGGVEVVVR